MKRDILTDLIRQEIEEADATISLLVENLRTKEIIYSYEESRTVVSASIIKVPVMVAALELVAEGKLTLNSRIAITKDQILEDTEVFEYGPGFYTLEELIVWMIINSDNTATNCLIDYFTMEWINECIRKMKLKHTKLERNMLDFEAISRGLNNYTSAEDMRVLYEALYSKTLLTKELCDYAIHVLTRQRHKQNALRYIKDSVVVAHKTGGLDFLNHDAGIFYLDKIEYYFGAFVTDAPDNEYGKRLIGRISKLIYEYYV